MKYKLFTDGSYKKLINKAAFGGYLEDASHNIVFSFSEEIKDEKLFNQHELLGLKYGLEQCIKRNIKKVECYCDFKEMTVAFSTKDEDAFFKKYQNENIYCQIWLLKKQFEEISFNYIPSSKNKLADKLSKKELSVYKVDKNSHNIKNIFSKNQYHTKSGRNKFYNLIKNTNVYYAFELLEKNKGTCLDKILNIYKVEFKYKISFNLIKTIILNNQSSINVDILHKINEILKDNKEKNVGLYFKPEHLLIGHMLKKISPINGKIKKDFEELEIICKDIDKIVIHQHPAITKHFNEISSKIQKRRINNFYRFKNLSNQKLIEYIQILGENYKIGSRKDIEDLIDLTDSDKNNPTKIQQKYFNILLQKQYQQEIERKKFNNQWFSKESLEEGPKKVEFLKQDLINKGIKLNF